MASGSDAWVFAVLLYKPDLVGQADHAPESRRSWHQVAMPGCLQCFCTNPIWSVRRVTRRNRADCAACGDARVLRCSTPVQPQSGRQGGSRIGIDTILPGHTSWGLRVLGRRDGLAGEGPLGLALRTARRAVRRSAGGLVCEREPSGRDQSSAVSCAAIGWARGMNSGADRACSTASANARTSYGSGPLPSRLAIGDAMTGIPVARSSVG